MGKITMKTQDSQQNTRGTKQKGREWLLLSALIAVLDFIAAVASYFLALWIRFDFVYSSIPQIYITAFNRFILPYAALVVLVMWVFRLYRALWRYIGLREMVRTIEASLLLSVIHAAGITILFKRMPISYYLGGAMIQMVLFIGIRISYRLFLMIRNRLQHHLQHQ